MSKNENIITLETNEDNFGSLLPYIEDINVTDIEYAAGMLWITDLIKGKYRVDNHGITDSFLSKFSNLVANQVNKQFNKVDHTLEAETEELRIEILHETICASGVTISIRKSLPIVRHTVQSIIASGYCIDEILALMINCIYARVNIIFGGEPGVGKTEFMKFFTQFIPENKRVITIEDTLEMHYSEINPGKDCVELKVDLSEDSTFDYSDAIKCCMRLNPKWMWVSEVRGKEAKNMIEGWSTGVKGCTSLHTDDVRKIPDRLLNMIGNDIDAARLKNTIFEFLNVGLLIRKRKIRTAGDSYRYMDQLALFARENGENKIYMIVENGEVVSHDLPSNLMKEFKRSGIEEPFKNDIVDREKELVKHEKTTK